MNWPDFWAQVLPPLAALLVALIMWGLRKLFKKIDWDVKARQDAAIRELIRAAIGGAEEWAASKLKASGSKPDGAEKLEWVRQQVDKLWPNAIPDDLDGLIHQELARVSGAGATGDRVFTGTGALSPVGRLDDDPGKPEFPTF